MATIEFSEEQTMLMDTAVDFCRKHSPLERVRAQIDQPQGIDPSVWQEMIDLGWLGITVPEQYGGLGLYLPHSKHCFGCSSSCVISDTWDNFQLVKQCTFML